MIVHSVTYPSGYNIIIVQSDSISYSGYIMCSILQCDSTLNSVIPSLHYKVRNIQIWAVCEKITPNRFQPIPKLYRAALKSYIRRSKYGHTSYQDDLVSHVIHIFSSLLPLVSGLTRFQRYRVRSRSFVWSEIRLGLSSPYAGSGHN